MIARIIYILIIGIIAIAVNALDNVIDKINYDGYVIVDNLRIRENYSIDSKILGFLKIGTAIRCTEITKNKYNVDSDINYWYKCTPSAFGETGWVYGKYISKNKFDKNKYISTLPVIKYYSKIYNSLVNTSWSSCRGNEPMECYATVFKKTTVETYGMEGNCIFYIESIKESGNNITLIVKLIMANYSINSNPNKIIQMSISINENRTIKIDNAIRYKI